MHVLASPRNSLMRSLLFLLSLALVAGSALAQSAEPGGKPDPAATPQTTPAAPASKKQPDPPKPALPPMPKPTAEVTLHVGAGAPAIKADDWIKTQQIAAQPDITAFESGKVYIVEFWATWCPSCREAMPGLAKLAKTHGKDLQIIGVCSSERKPPKDAPDHRLDRVRSFVDEHAEHFPYPVIFDGTRAMASNWIVAAGRIFLPTAFVIDSAGVIAWIGDPRDREFEGALTKALKAVPHPEPPPAAASPDPQPPKKPSKSKK